MQTKLPATKLRKEISALRDSILLVLLALVLVFQQNTVQGAVLHNGTNCSGTVPQYGTIWYTFEATAGDYTTLSVVKTDGVFRQPGITLYAPNGTTTFSYNVNQTSLLTNRATMSGTYTAAVYTTSGSGGAFNYILRSAQLPRPFIVPAGDDGGPLTNGAPGSGTLAQGDLDLWSFVAEAGDYVALRVGVDSAVGTPLQMDVRTPNGELLSSSGTSGTDARIEIPSASNGTYSLSIRAKTLSDTATYKLNLARMPGNPTSAGTLVNGITKPATLAPGGLSQWTFYACKSNVISLRCDAQGANVYYPRIQIFAQDGHSVGDTAGARLRVNTLSVRAPYSGRFTVLIQSVNLGGQGPYFLTGTGIAADGMTVCPPLILGGELETGGLRGTPDAPYVLLSTTDITQPRAEWESVTAGHFNQWGAFEFRMPFNRNEPQRYFLLKTP